MKFFGFILLTVGFIVFMMSDFLRSINSEGIQNNIYVYKTASKIFAIPAIIVGGIITGMTIVVLEI